MDQPGNNHLLLRTSQAAYNEQRGQTRVADRMRELLARTVHDHLTEERSVASALQDIRRRLDALDYPGASGTAARVDGLATAIDALAATIGTLDSRLTARLERLDERLDDQYDCVRSIDGKLDRQPAPAEEALAKAVEGAAADITARITSLEDTVLTLAEVLLRPGVRTPHQHAAISGHSLPAGRD